MKLKDFFAFKDWLSYRQKVGLLVIAGVVCGLGGLFMYLLRAHTYFIGDNPSACVNCHIMTPYYATWSHSSHGRLQLRNAFEYMQTSLKQHINELLLTK
jgi:cytochrome c nitrite reductase small subunit